MSGKLWRIRLGAFAEQDFLQILDYTTETFGTRQSAIYQTLLSDALAALAAGPDLPQSTSRETILPGLRSLHIARRGRPGRHFILYRAAAGDIIEIIRILHESMDIVMHMSADTTA